MDASIPAGNPILARQHRLDRCASYLRAWVWLIPCWVWKYFFLQCSREAVRLNGQPRFLVRLDGEFALVYDPIDGPSIEGAENQPRDLSRKHNRRCNKENP